MTYSNVNADQLQQELRIAIKAAVSAAETKHGVTIPWLAVIELRDRTKRKAPAVLTDRLTTTHAHLIDARNVIPTVLTNTFDLPFEQ